MKKFIDEKTIIIDGVEYVPKEQVQEPTTYHKIEGYELEWKKEEPEELTWHEAMDLYRDNPEGWRLPTRVELLNAYVDGVDGFASSLYWSSSEYDAGDAWSQYFYNGNQNYDFKDFTFRVRAVRTIKRDV